MRPSWACGWRTGFGAGVCGLALAAIWPLPVRASAAEIVTVTAQHEPRDAFDVPLSVSVIDGELLRSRDLLTADALSAYAANTYVSQQQFYVRGVGTGNGFGFDPSVAVYSDGVYLGRATAVTGLLWDLAQAEIVR